MLATTVATRGNPQSNNKQNVLCKSSYVTQTTKRSRLSKLTHSSKATKHTNQTKYSTDTVDCSFTSASTTSTTDETVQFNQMTLASRTTTTRKEVIVNEGNHQRITLQATQFDQSRMSEETLEHKIQDQSNESSTKQSNIPVAVNDDSKMKTSQQNPNLMSTEWSGNADYAGNAFEFEMQFQKSQQVVSKPHFTHRNKREVLPSRYTKFAPMKISAGAPLSNRESWRNWKSLSEMEKSGTGRKESDVWGWFI